MTSKTTLIVLSAAAGGLLLIGQFVPWFQTSITFPSGGGFPGGSVSAGYNPWSVSGSTSFGGGGSQSWMSQLGKDGSTWQTTLMAFDGPLLLLATILSGIAILPLLQGKTRLSAILSFTATGLAAVGTIFAFLYNYTQENGSSMDIFVGAFMGITGTILAFVAGAATSMSTSGNVPGATTPGTEQPPAN